jgi:actin-related protein
MDLIVDMGSYETIIGKAGADTFETVEPTIYADSNNPLLKKSIISSLSEMAQERFYGKAALNFKNVLKITYFMQYGDYESFSNLIKQTLESLYMDPRDSGLILIVPSMTTQLTKQKIQKFMFENLHFPRITFIPDSICVLTALGLKTGVIVDIGHFSTKIECLFKGFPNNESQFEFPIGGYHITQSLLDQLFSNLQFKSVSPLMWICEDIKRAAAFCELNPTETIQLINQGSTEYDQPVQLPNGLEFIINQELFECVEPIFNPERVHIRADGIISYIKKSIRAWERTQVPDFLKSIILCGNGGKIQGLREKIEQLLRKEFPSTLEMNFIALKEHKNLFWLGASILYTKKEGKFDWIENPEGKQGGN